MPFCYQVLRLHSSELLQQKPWSPSQRVLTDPYYRLHLSCRLDLQTQHIQSLYEALLNLDHLVYWIHVNLFPIRACEWLTAKIHQKFLQMVKTQLEDLQPWLQARDHQRRQSLSSGPSPSYWRYFAWFLVIYRSCCERRLKFRRFWGCGTWLDLILGGTLARSGRWGKCVLTIALETPTSQLSFYFDFLWYPQISLLLPFCLIS